ncbi:MAG: radical SAM protein [Planctomycetota bacterium]|jgi:uncharacterized protein|nr:radical SAM protein [Planctomycetota bacterium]
MQQDNEQTLSVTFHLTHSCNLRCTYCYTGEKSGKGMTRETADRAVDFAIEEARAQGAQHLEVVFFGGEPLMRMELLCYIADETTRRASDLRVSFKLSTNGLLLTEDKIRELSARQIYISISIDGAPEVQDAQRPNLLGEGTSSKLSEVIERLLEWNPCTNVTCVVTPWSAGSLDESVMWLFEQGFAYVSPALDYSAPWTPADLARLELSLRRLADWYVENTLDGMKFYLSCFDERIQTWTKGPLQTRERCSIGIRQFSIAPSGRLYPCVQFVRDDADSGMVIGDIHSGFDEEKRMEVNCQSEAEKPECDGCTLHSRCSSWCACVNWQSTGHIDRASPLVCQYEQVLMPIADDVGKRLWKQRNPNFVHKHYNPAFPVLSFAEQLMIEEIDHANQT